MLEEERLWEISQKERMSRKFGPNLAASALKDPVADPLLAMIAELHGRSRARITQLVRECRILSPKDQKRLIAIAASWAREADPLAAELGERFGRKEVTFSEVGVARARYSVRI